MLRLQIEQATFKGEKEYVCEIDGIKLFRKPK